MAGIRKPGEFCWINMLTPQPDAARRRSSASCSAGPISRCRGWVTASRWAGRTSAACSTCTVRTRRRAAAAIGVMVKVDNADATCEKVKRAGRFGEVAFDVMENCGWPLLRSERRRLRSLGVRSRSRAPKSTATFTARPLVRDVDHRCRARDEVLLRLFGWKSDVKSMPGYEYTVFSLGDRLLRA